MAIVRNNSAARLKPNCAISPATADRVVLNAVCLNGIKAVDFILIDITTDNVVAHFGHTGTANKANVA
jgi:hypothetical protein